MNGPTARIEHLAVAFLPILIAIGNATLWIGNSSITVPLALAVVVPLALFAAMRGIPEDRSLLAAFSLICVAVTISSAWAVAHGNVRPTRSLASALPYFCALAVVLAVMHARRPKAGLGFTMAGLLVAATVVLSWSAYRVSLAISGDEFVFYNYKAYLVTMLGGSNLLALFLAFCAPFAWRENKCVWAVMALAVCLTFSRYGVIFFGVATLATVWLSIRPLQINLILYCIAIIAAAGLFVNVVLSVPQIAALALDIGVPLSVIRRAELISFSMSVISQNPLLGAGAGGLRTATEAGWDGIEVEAHNSILALWLDGGILAVAGLMAVLVIFYRSTAAEEWALLRIAVSVLLAYSMFEPALEVSSIMMLLAYAVAMPFMCSSVTTLLK